jgi:hypothetical protein
MPAWNTAQNDSSTTPPLPACGTCALGTALQDMALADRVRYHVNVYWEKAPDYRTSRTLDWLNDACEAKLEEQDRDQFEVKYTALMSPASIAFIFSDASLSASWKRLITRANRARLGLNKGQYIRKSPSSLLLTTELYKADAAGRVRHIKPHVLLGTKKRLGRRAAVKKIERTGIRCHKVQRVPPDIAGDPVRRVTDHFQCMLHIGTVSIDVRFATEFEATVLFKYLNPGSDRDRLQRRAAPEYPR